MRGEWHELKHAAKMNQAVREAFRRTFVLVRSRWTVPRMNSGKTVLYTVIQKIIFHPFLNAFLLPIPVWLSVDNIVFSHPLTSPRPSPVTSVLCSKRSVGCALSGRWVDERRWHHRCYHPLCLGGFLRFENSPAKDQRKRPTQNTVLEHITSLISICDALNSDWVGWKKYLSKRLISCSEGHRPAEE